MCIATDPFGDEVDPPPLSAPPVTPLNRLARAPVPPASKFLLRVTDVAVAEGNSLSTSAGTFSIELDLDAAAF